MSVRQAEQLATRLVEAPKRVKKQDNKMFPDIFYFEQQMQEVLGTKVEVLCGRNPKKGRLVIHYHSLEELDNIASRLKNKIL